MLGHQLGAGVLVAGGAALDQRRFAAADLGPGNGWNWLHGQSFCHFTTPGSGGLLTLKIRTRPPGRKVPGSLPGPAGSPVRMTGSETRRPCHPGRGRLHCGRLYGYASARRERDFRQLVDRGDAALARTTLFAAIESFSGAIALKNDSMLGYLKRGEAYRRRQQLDSRRA